MIPRRTFLAGGPLALAGCGGKENPYFGKTTPPSGQRLVFQIIGEPETLDPTRTSGGPGEWNILPALFEGLVTPHPETAEPMAGLATHYESSPDHTRFTFYLRGHASPRGVRLPDTYDLPPRFSGDRNAPRGTKPARWSDGTVITAHDFVYSWRRAINPETGAFYAVLLYYLKNAADINAGKRSPDDLGVRAADDFTLSVELATSVPFFVHLTAVSIYSAVPRQAIEAAGDSWTDPRNIVTSGAFTLQEWRPYDQVVVVKNPRYYEAELVRLREIAFVPFSDENTLLNFYKSGEAHSIDSVNVPFLTPALHGKRDYYTHPMFGIKFYTFNVTKPPFDNVLLRYAFNMAVDKRALAKWMGNDRKVARSFVPPLATYQPLNSLPIAINGKKYDVLAFDPAGARDLLSAGGFPDGKRADGQTWAVKFIHPQISSVKLTAEILQQQWRRNLGVDLKLLSHDFPTFLQLATNLRYEAISDSWDCGRYADPNWFLSQFQTGSIMSGTGWSDPAYDVELARANATIDPTERMTRLASCERRLLTAMPVIPLYFDTWSYLHKPYVCGGGGNLLNIRRFKYAWIDTNWRPS